MYADISGVQQVLGPDQSRLNVVWIGEWVFRRVLTIKTSDIVLSAIQNYVLRIGHNQVVTACHSTLFVARREHECTLPKLDFKNV